MFCGGRNLHRGWTIRCARAFEQYIPQGEYHITSLRGLTETRRHGRISSTCFLRKHPSLPQICHSLDPRNRLAHAVIPTGSIPLRPSHFLPLDVSATISSP